MKAIGAALLLLGWLIALALVPLVYGMVRR